MGHRCSIAETFGAQPDQRLHSIPGREAERVHDVGTPAEAANNSLLRESYKLLRCPA